MDRAIGLPRDLRGVLPEHSATWAPTGERLLPLRAPALHGALHSIFLATAHAPELGEARIFRSGALGFLEIVEAHPDRDRHAFAANDAFPIAQGGDRVEKAARAFGHGCLDERLIAVVVEPHREDRAALRQHTFGKVRRALGDKP